MKMKQIEIITETKLESCHIYENPTRIITTTIQINTEENC